MLKSLNYPVIFLTILVGRAAYMGCGVGDAIAIVGLAGLCAYNIYIEGNKERPMSDGFRLELDNLRSTVDSLKIAKTLGRL